MHKICACFRWHSTLPSGIVAWVNGSTTTPAARTRPLTTAVATVATAALLAVGLPAAASAAPPAAPPPSDTPGRAAAQVHAPVPEIDWEPCEDADGFDCATVEVPTDYDRPHGPTTTIALTRLPATDPESRIGSMLTNFGGPGGPGVENLHLVGEVMVEPQVRERFDLVGFDPRGVAGSDPVTCFRDDATEQEFLSTITEIPLTPAEDRRAVAGFARLAAGCQLWSGQRLASASTANVARDMDLLRQALGDDQLTYLGYSYGTILGATYSALFPDRVRAMVLDGTIDPVAWSGVGSDSSTAERLGQAEATTETFAEFTRLCAEAG
jgi:pimeloyl-ACP methyl ester carboxylesterase